MIFVQMNQFPYGKVLAKEWVSCDMSLQDYPVQYQTNCTAVDNYEARMSMVPKKWPNGLPLNPYGIPMDDPPEIPGAICNFAMPDHSTRERYLWVRLWKPLQQGGHSSGDHSRL